MKRFFLILLTATLFLATKTDVIALDSCTQEEQLRLRQIASLTTYQYELVDYGYTDTFTVTISGFTKELYATIADENYQFVYQEGSDKTSAIDFLPGKSYKLDFYATDETACSGTKILTKYLQIPYYNYYSDNPICKGYESYILCNKYTNLYKSIKSEEEFVLRVKEYIKSLEEKPPVSDEDDTKEEVTLINQAIIFLENYYMFILIPIIAIGTAVIIVVEVRKRRSIL